jgi:hypothetical protein
MSEDLLERASELVKTGQKQAAEPIIRQYLDAHPDDVRGWWVLANATNDPKLKRRSLERVLQSIPDHAKAWEMLDALNKPPPKKPAPQVVPAPQVRSKPRRRGCLPNWLLLALIIAVAVGGALFLTVLRPEPKIKRAVMARDGAGNDVTTVFGQRDAIYCYVSVTNTLLETVDLRTVWYRVEAENSAEQFEDVTKAGVRSWAWFMRQGYARTTQDAWYWPAGNYEVWVYLDDHLDRILTFEVQ